MGFRPTADELAILIEEIDEDGSGAIEFGEFAQLCAKFLVEVEDFIFYMCLRYFFLFHLSFQSSLTISENLLSPLLLVIFYFCK